MKHWTTLAAAGLIAAAAIAPAKAAEITGAGSTFVYPILAKWADAYKKATGIGLNYQSIGSGGGIKQITNKTVTFGASDMPLTPADVAKDGFVQFPVINGAVVPVVNLDGIKPIEPGVYLVTDWVSGPLYRVDAQGNVVRLLDLHQGTGDLTFLPETKTILIPLMLDNALVAYKLE